jgi:glycosyltransferase involved in cell wall biosynthesis
MKRIDISIVLPCLNEELTLGKCIKEAQEWAKTEHLQCEVVVADNGSTDGSLKIARELGASIVNVSERGYGAAADAGIRAAKSEFVLMADSDYSYNLSHTGRFLAKLREGSDLVVGNRFAGKIEPGAMPWKNRYIGNPVLSSLARILFGLKIRDFHCGIRAVRKSAYFKVNPRTPGMEFATEMILRFAKMGFLVSEVETDLRKDLRDRKPHLRPWRDGFRHLFLLFLLQPRALLTTPSALLFLIATAASLALYVSGGMIVVNDVKFGSGSQIVLSVFAAMFLLGIVLGEALSAFSNQVLFRNPSEIGRVKVFELGSMATKILLVSAGLFLVSVFVIGMYFITVQINPEATPLPELVATVSSSVATILYLAFGLFAIGILLSLLSYSSMSNLSDSRHLELE